MPVNVANYDPRGKNNQGIVVRCPNLVGPHLVYFDHDTVTGSWTIRDFISSVWLDNHHSTLTVTQIENDADHDEFPPWCNAQTNSLAWELYLRYRTTAAFRTHAVPPPTPPNAASGTWQPLP
jgi:hypothetical protein